MSFRLLFFVVFLFFASCASRTAIQFEVAKQLNTPSGYQDFLDNNPDSVYNDEVLDSLELSMVNKALQDRDEETLNRFLQKYPNSPYVGDALKIRKEIVIEKIFEEVKEADSLSEYLNFIQKYPNQNLVKDAEKLYYKKYLQTTSGEQDLLVDKNQEDPDANSKEQESQSAKNQTAKDAATDTASLLSQPKLQVPRQRIDSDIANIFGTSQNSSSLLDDGFQDKKPEDRAEIKDKEIESSPQEVILEGRKAIVIPEESGQVVAPGDQKQKTGNQVLEDNPFFQSPTKDFSYLIDDSNISLKDSAERILYGKNFRPVNSPRIVQPEFTFFIQTLQRTDNYVRIKTRFHNLKDKSEEFQFSRVSLVNNHGKRVKPINAKGVNWNFADSGSIKSSHLANQVSELDFLFPSLNLFGSNHYKLYITLNNRNYLIQI